MQKLLLPALLAAFSTLMAQDAPRAAAVDPFASEAAKPGKPAKPAPPAPVPGDPFVKGNPDAKKPASKPATEEPARPVNYQALLETFDLSREDFVALLDERGDDEARYRRIAEWLPAGRAKLATFSAATVRSGQRMVLESVDEVNYATELDPPKAEEDAAFPTTFETRNAGETLELELTVGDDGQRAEVNIAPSFCRLVRFADEFASPGRANSAVSQPRFATRKLTSTAALTMNQPRLLGTLSGGGEDGANAGQVRVAFFTVRPNVLPRAKPEAVALGSKLLRMEYTFFSLDRAAARELWLAKPEPQGCYDALRALVVEKKARLEHASINVTQGGQRTVTEEIEELRYATEFNPPAIPEPASHTATAGEAKAVSTATVRLATAPGDWPKKAMIPATGDAFEVRNVGFTSEIEPVVGEDGATVELNCALNFTRYLGSLEVTGIAKSYPPRPLFEARKFTGPLTATVGQQQFISTFNLPIESGANGRKDDGRVWLGFVRAVVVK